MSGGGPVRRVVHCMGTVFSFDVRPPGAGPEVLDEAAALLHEIDRTFSTYRADSPISRLARGDLDLDDCPPDVRFVLAECERFGNLTDGYFSAYASGQLDPSGYVKGWAIERAGAVLSRAGSRNHYLNGGGDLLCAGSAAPTEPWRIAISDPRRPGRIATVVAGTEFAVATSGVEQRGAHIVDPHTARAPTGLLSLTIVGPRLVEADVYATAGFAMGAAAREWVEELADHRAFAVAANGSTWSTF